MEHGIVKPMEGGDSIGASMMVIISFLVDLLNSDDV